MDSENRPLSPFWNGPNPATGAPGTGAAAVGSGLPSLKKDNCIRKENLKAHFLAEENIRLYILKAGEANVGFLTVTVPCECLSARDFQKHWHSFLTNGLKKLFPDGMWTRERQPRSGNWHAHAVVNLRCDFKTGFPFAQVEKKFYANVPPWIRELWKKLREIAEKYGFGRIELLPLKHSGKASARYLTKYLTKATSSEKSEGEEKCRLFGIWGKVRFVNSKFCWLVVASSKSARNGLPRYPWFPTKAKSKTGSAPIGGISWGRNSSMSSCRWNIIRSEKTGNWGGMTLGGQLMKPISKDTITCKTMRIKSGSRFTRSSTRRGKSYSEGKQIRPTTMR